MEETIRGMSVIDPSMIKTEVDEEQFATDNDSGDDVDSETPVLSMPEHDAIKTEVEEYQAHAGDENTVDAGIVVKRRTRHDSQPGHSSVDTPDVTLLMTVEEVEREKSDEEPGGAPSSYLRTVGDKSFPDRSALSTHEHDIHTAVEPNKCPHCDKAFTWPSQLAAHTVVHTGDKPFECSICNKTFTSSSSLTRHQRVHTGEKPFQCRICGQKFAWSHQLTEHERIHAQKPFECCGETFTTSSSLSQHQRSHSDRKLSECEFCNKKFTQAGYLVEHLRVHTGEKPFQCGVCNQKFSRSNNLIRHQRLHGGEEPFGCSTCGKTFKHSATLIQHHRIHAGREQKTLECDICKASFAQPSALKEHKEIHAKERPFKCSTCGKRFKYNSSYNRHCRAHHEND